jgi:cytochrome c peroxidase
MVLVSVSAHAEIAAIPKVAPAPPANPVTAEKIELGRLLFFDPRLSKTKTVSCSSCHSVVGEAGRIPSGTDGTSVSAGILGMHGSRNAPTVWNAGLRSSLFWDGRANSLEEQAKGPLLNPIEMAMPDAWSVVRTVNSIPGYRERFRKIYANPESGRPLVNFDRVADVIATYERTLVTPNSKFDRFQRGETGAMNEIEKRGWEKFNKLACIACHGTPTFTGRDYFIRFPLRGTARDLDEKYHFSKDDGRYAVTKDLADLNKYRVPSLRNVEITGPYFHNGSVEKLEDAVRLMGRAQIGVVLPDDDVRDLVAFLKTLTGVVPPEKAPRLPE